MKSPCHNASVEMEARDHGYQPICTRCGKPCDTVVVEGKDEPSEDEEERYSLSRY